VRSLVLILSLLATMTGCEDRYRYFCQDPKNFSAKRCQRPDCLFTQDCPDYLVAPVLEKQLKEQQQQPQPAASEPIK
jgi:hypothetical protein